MTIVVFVIVHRRSTICECIFQVALWCSRYIVFYLLELKIWQLMILKYSFWYFCYGELMNASKTSDWVKHIATCEEGQTNSFKGSFVVVISFFLSSKGEKWVKIARLNLCCYESKVRSFLPRRRVGSWRRRDYPLGYM